MDDSSKSSRNASVEALRVLLMFLIVLYHSWARGIYSDSCGGTRIYDWWTPLLLLFLWHVRLPGFVNKICCSLAPSMFGVYLIHNEMFGGKELYRAPTRYLVGAGMHPFFALVVAALLCFIACVLLDLLRRGIVNRLSVAWSKSTIGDKLMAVFARYKPEAIIGKVADVVYGR